ncbi:MAG: flagellar hook-length control protein FliK [Mariprofundaceae bacterium]|nr:flagellar hook-length control protein FliK [Mariprofundaceae bacterium]
MSEQIQVGGAVKGVSAIAGKGGHTGKNGLFAPLMALFDSQHGQNHQIKNKTGKAHRSAGAGLQTTGKSVLAHRGKNGAIISDIEDVKKITAQDNKKSALAASDGERLTHVRRLKDQNAAVGLAVPVTFIQTSKTGIQTVEVQQKKLSGILQQKHTNAEEATSRKHAQAAELSMPIQDHVRQGSLDEQETGAKEAGLKEQKVAQKLPDSPELLVNNNPADQKPVVGEGKNHIKQSAYLIPHALNNPEISSTIKPEATAGKAMLSAPTASGLAANLSPEINAENIPKETVRETNVIPNALSSELHEAKSTRKHKGNKAATTNLSTTQTTLNEGKAFTSASQNPTAHAHNIDGRPESPIRHNQNQAQHANAFSRTLAHGLTPGDAQYGNPADQQTNQQGNQAGADNRFAGLVQTDSSISRSNPQSTTLHRSFQHLRVMDAMNEIAHSAKNGHARLDIQLEPAHLGKIHISLQTDAAKQLMVHITAEQTVSQQVIQQNIPQLRHALEQQGLSLGQFSMSTGSQDSSGADQQFNGRHEWGAMDGLSSDASPTSIRTDTQTTSSGHGRLSIHV